MSQGFGIPFLVDKVRVYFSQGLTVMQAIEAVGKECELRSEAIYKLKEVFHIPVEQPSSKQQLQPLLEWIWNICIDDSRTHYRRIQSIMLVIRKYREVTAHETTAVQGPCPTCETMWTAEKVMTPVTGRRFMQCKVCLCKAWSDVGSVTSLSCLRADCPHELR